MTPKTLSAHVELILSQAEDVWFGGSRLGLAESPNAMAANLEFPAEQADPVSEHLDTLRLLYSSVPDPLKDAFWKSTLNYVNRPLLAGQLVGIFLGEVQQFERLVVLGDLWRMHGATASWAAWCRGLWFGLRSALYYRSRQFSTDDLETLDGVLGTMGDSVMRRSTQVGKSVHGVFAELLAAKSTLSSLRYQRLRQSLLRIENPELNTDRRKFLERVSTLDFSADIAAAIESVERQLQSSATTLNLKQCMDLTRSVVEKIVQESAERVALKTGMPAPVAGGSGVSYFGSFKAYLVTSGLLTVDDGKFMQELYNYLSNQGAHRLGSTAEQVRISKNIAIEFGLMLLERVQRHQAVGSTP